MSIQEHLNKIRNAIYGREVRESIAKGIETAYNDASEKNNANMEVKMARGTNPNLNTRLNKMEETDQQTTAQLAHTETKLRFELENTDNRVDNLILEYDINPEKDPEIIDARGSAETVGKRLSNTDSAIDTLRKSTLTAKNKFINSGFLNGIEGWTAVRPENVNMEVINNQLHFTMVGLGENGLGPVLSQLVELKEGHTYFFQVNSKTTKVKPIARLEKVTSPYTLVARGIYLGTGDFYQTRERFEVAETGDYYLNVGNWEPDFRETTVIDNFMLIDLTETFGLGNEPSAEEIGKLIDNYHEGWFEGSRSLIANSDMVNEIENIYTSLKNTDDKIEKILEDGVVGASKSPYPPKIIPNEINRYRYLPSGTEKRYRVVDDLGYVYATRWDKVLKLHIDDIKTSTDADWEILWEPNTEEDGQINTSALMVTETGRVVVCTQANRVYVSDENQGNFTDTGIRMSAFTNLQFGYGHYENLVWVSTYGEAPIDSTEIYLSRDYGATWEMMSKIPRITDVINSHIHDIQYDPYDDRFWVVFGDQQNCNIFYSDDYGKNWLKVFGDFAVDIRNTQLTSISTFPHGVVFGADHAPGGVYPNNEMEDNLRYWPRPTGQRQAIVDPADIYTIYKPFNDSVFRAFAMKDWQGKVGENILTLIPWYGVVNNTLLLASIDGLNWFNIYEGVQTGQWQIAGVYDNRIIGFDRDEAGRMCLLDMPVPEWL